MAAKGNTASSAANTLRGREIRSCPNCQQGFDVTKSSRKKYCSTLCMRSYLAARFDRWVATPHKLAVPQNYDEFLTSEVLSCLVPGCTWSGHHLSLHLNLAHGVSAAEFKQEAGFNAGTGVISATLQKTLSLRDKTGIALNPGKRSPKYYLPTSRSVAAEEKEHRKKTFALLKIVQAKPIRTCQFCKVQFEQPNAWGISKFCSNTCKQKNQKLAVKTKQIQGHHPRITCAGCGQTFEKKNIRGRATYCSEACRARHYKAKRSAKKP
ncbi:MAG: hypothetical protein ACYC3W_09300 [Candidatus Nanopelagicales bacterium]